MRNPQNSVGNYLGPCIKQLTRQVAVGSAVSNLPGTSETRAKIVSDKPSGTVASSLGFGGLGFRALGV